MKNPGLEEIDQRPDALDGKMRRRSIRLPVERWKNWSHVPAWAVSVVFHTLILVGLAIFLQPSIRGTNATEDRRIGIALIHRSSMGTEYSLVEGGSGSDSTSDATKEKRATATDVSQSGPSMDIDAVLSNLMGADSKSNSAGDAGSQTGSVGLVGSGNKSAGTGGTGTTAEFFGVKGYGTSFVFVLDRSDSMNDFDGAPLRAAKKELATSLDSLNSACQFQIVFYNDAPILYRSTISRATGLLFANDNEKRQASDFVRSTIAIGGTEHLAALKQGIRLGPDVVFFLTDAAEPRLGVDQIQEMVQDCGGRTTIHSVEFGTGPSRGNGGWIEALATRTRGTYRYVDVTELPR